MASASSIKHFGPRRPKGGSRSLLQYLFFPFLLMLLMVATINFTLLYLYHTSMIDDNEQSKGYTSKLLDRFQLSSATPGVTVGETELSFKTQTTVDPFLEPVSCLELLDSYRKKQIVQLKDQITYHKSYVRLMKTEIPFYLSTSDKTVDSIRAEMFDKGDYYEVLVCRLIRT
jgi:hypothetical protein